MHQAKKQIFQTSIGLGSMVMEQESPSSGATTSSSAPNTPTKTSAADDDDEDGGPGFHRRDTIVRGNGRKRCPQPPLYMKPCLRRGEADEDSETPLTPPTRKKSVAARLVEI